mmetsp:Transcript_9311/g.20387  ORF Transcript_9311/g.20387 Transcript_9311/m.20387 type:complete len:325 (+) Transcript_9311:713-1687(+)
MGDQVSLRHRFGHDAALWAAPHAVRRHRRRRRRVCVCVFGGDADAHVNARLHDARARPVLVRAARRDGRRRPRGEDALAPTARHRPAGANHGILRRVLNRWFHAQRADLCHCRRSIDICDRLGDQPRRASSGGLGLVGRSSRIGAGAALRTRGRAVAVAPGFGRLQAGARAVGAGAGAGGHERRAGGDAVGAATPLAACECACLSCMLEVRAARLGRPRKGVHVRLPPKRDAAEPRRDVQVVQSYGRELQSFDSDSWSASAALLFASIRRGSRRRRSGHLPHRTWGLQQAPSFALPHIRGLRAASSFPCFVPYSLLFAARHSQL